MFAIICARRLISLVMSIASLAVLLCLFNTSSTPFHHDYLLIMLFTAFLVTQIYNGQYTSNAYSEPNLFQFFRTISLKWILVVAILSTAFYALDTLKNINLQIILIWFCVTPFVITIAQVILQIFVLQYLNKKVRKTTVIVGATDTGVKLAKEFKANPYYATEFLGFFDDRQKSRLPLTTEDHLIGRFTDVAEFVKRNHVQVIYLSLPVTLYSRVEFLLEELKDTTASVYFAPDIVISNLIQARTANIGEIPLFAVCETPFFGKNRAIKRCSDIFFSCIILTLIAPILIIVALGVKFTSPGPIIFKQRRYGLDGREILVYKFRSMTVTENADVVTQATKTDARITPFGGFLRRTSLDELPQFINVLQGRMSIVGPRPHAVAHNEMYRKLIKGYMMRHKVKPGITGWAQVNGCRGETDTLDKMQNRIDKDLDYLRNWSIWLDIAIIFKTIKLVFKDEQAY